MSGELPRPGDVLGGRHALGERLGEGAMGAVFAALDRGAGDRPVAVKVLRRSLGRDPAVRRRFEREAAVLGALGHPAVVRVLGAGHEPDGLAWIALERIDGETLAARIARVGPLAPAALGEVVAALAGGLAEAHDRGILHGDLKPANVFLVSPGGAKLVDFGLAKVEGLERLTRTGELGGTPAYLAPEVITGEAPLDARSDVYGLGLTLWEALAGRPAFAGANPGKLLFAVASGALPPLADVRPGTPAPLAALVARATARAPADRFPDVRALALRWAEVVASEGERL